MKRIHEKLHSISAYCKRSEINNTISLFFIPHAWGNHLLEAINEAAPSDLNSLFIFSLTLAVIT